MPARFETAKGISMISAVAIDIDPKSGLSNNIQRLQIELS
jgi:calcineurin-like phosphoesterase